MNTEGSVINKTKKVVLRYPKIYIFTANQTSKQQIKNNLMQAKINAFMDMVKQRNHHEPEFLQAVQEVAETVIPYIVKNDIYHGKNILLRMVEPRCKWK